MAQDLKPENLIGHQLLDGEGHSVGKINQVYLDDRTNEPSWVSVHTGLFGRKETLVPLQGAQPYEEDLQVPYDKATVKDAPHLDSGTHISPETEAQVRDYYAGRAVVPQQRGGRHERGYSEVPVSARGSGEEAPDEGAAEADTGARAEETGGRAESPADEDVVTESGTPGVLSEEEKPEPGAEHGREHRESGTVQAPGAMGEPMTAGAGEAAAPVRSAGSGTGSATGTGDSAAGAPDTVPGPAGTRQGPGPATAPSVTGTEAEDAMMTRSEEQVDIGVERVEAGRARLHKYVDTEDFDETVTLRREELEVERRPVEGEEEGSRPRIGEEEQVFTLYEERPVVSKQQVPVERVHVRKRMVSHEEHVQGTRHNERIEVEDEEGRPPSQG